MAEEKKVSENFINNIKKWVELDDTINKLKDEIKIIVKEKKDAEEIILKDLDKMEEKIINLKDGKLRKNVSKTQVPLKKDHIQKSIFDYIKDEKKTSDIITSMMKSRQTVEKINLKRTKNKEIIFDKK
jgi:hypothetical protein